MKKLMLVAFLLSSFLMQGQQNKLLQQINQFNDGIKQLKYVLDIKIDSIPEDVFSKLLKIKLNSDLDNLGDVFAFYTDGKELELSRKELSVLENRVLYFADWFVRNQRYVIVKSSGGVAPSTGVRSDSIANKRVAVLLMGGSCTITERDHRSDYIYTLFSNKVRNLLLQ
jgi:hypothetical protein